MSTGSQSLLVTVLDKHYKPIRNVTVQLELVNYSNIHHEYDTNQLGEVSFYYLPKHVQVHIEAICLLTKRYAYTQTDPLNYRNLTLILEEMSVFDEEEYDLSDGGYYTI